MKKKYKLQNTLMIGGLLFSFLASGTLMAQKKEYRIIKIEGEKYDTTSSAFEPNDYITYSYSAGRGSDLLTNTINADTADTYDWDGVNSQIGNRIIKQYDGNSNMLNQLEQDWDGVNSEWLNTSKTAYTYNSNHDMLSLTVQNWSSLQSKWIQVKSEKYAYTYDANNNLLTKTEQRWDTASSKWGNYSKSIYNYNSFNLESKVSQIWYSSAWHDSNREVYTYNSNRLEVVLSQSSGNNGWENRSRSQYIYSSTGWITTNINKFWDQVAGKWSPTETRNLYVHNPGDFYYSSITRQDYDTTLNTWVNSRSKREYTFTSFNKIDQYTYSQWGGSAWKPYSRSTYKYEEYSPTGLAEREYNQLKIVVFPNPAINIVNIQFENPEVAEIKLTVYDAVGRLVSQRNYGEKTIGAVHIFWNAAAHNAKSGMYIYQLKAGESVSSGQFMVH